MTTPTRTMLGLLLATGVAAATGCTDNARNKMAELSFRGADVRYDNEAESFTYLYRYYPEEQVYQGVYDYTWYWKDADGFWRNSPTLPKDIQLSTYFEVLDLPTTRPSSMHAQVFAEYPDSATLAARSEAWDIVYGNDSSDETTGSAFATVPTNTDRPE